MREPEGGGICPPHAPHSSPLSSSSSSRFYDSLWSPPGRTIVPPSEGPNDTLGRETGRIFISYKRDVEPDMSLASFLYAALTSQGYSVFKDEERIPTGADYGEVISSEIPKSDFFIVLLTKASTGRGWVVAEIEMAAKLSENLAGHPRILPVRLTYTQALPIRLQAAIGHLQHFAWNDATDNEKLLGAILTELAPRRDAAGAPSPRGPKDTPSRLSHGEHFIVTQNMWRSAGTRESLAETTIVPVVAGQETSLSVTRSTGPGFFRVRVLDSGALEVAIWSGANYRRVRSQPRKFITMMEGDTHGWCFARYTPDEAVLLRRPGGHQDPIAVTFDEEVVKAVWMITHQRATIRETFLIAMKHP